MKSALSLLILITMVACTQGPASNENRAGNPFFTGLNDPVQYADVSHEHLTGYANITLEEIDKALEGIRREKSPDFDNVFVAFDNIINDLTKASNNCFMFYWVSTDSLSRARGLEGFQLLDSLATSLTSDAGIYRQMVAFAKRDCFIKAFALLNAMAAPKSPTSHATNPEASGKAIFWQGYVARDGFGITRMRNQISDDV